ncbi:MAG: YihY/virulence factor BrkB family protein [Mycobacteriales bacterium]
MAVGGGLKDRVTGRLRRERQRRPWLDHLIRAYRRYKSANGDHLAAAITYFSFLSLFPLILLGISVTGFVLANNVGLQQELQDLIRQNVPGDLGRQLSDSVQSLIANRRAIGVVGLLGVAVGGLGWIGNLRTALQLVWSCEQVEENFVKAKLGDLLVLVGLGLGILLSVALTAGGTAAADQLVRAAGLEGVVGMGTLTTVLGYALALTADTVIFAWLFVRLPRRPVRYRTVLRGALFAAVGYEVLKVVATFYLTRVTDNPTYGPFASVIGLLIWIDLVSRFLLLAAAWTATGRQPKSSDQCPDPSEPDPPADLADRPAGDRGALGGVASGRHGQVGAVASGGRGQVGAVPSGAWDRREPAVAGDRRNSTPNPVAVAGVLVGTGAALGAGAAAAGHRYLRRRR